MLQTSQKKIKDFANLLRKKLIEGGVDKKYLNSVEDSILLEEFRQCADCGFEICTKDEQLRSILEFDSAEKAFDVLYNSTYTERGAHEFIHEDEDENLVINDEECDYCDECDEHHSNQLDYCDECDEFHDQDEIELLSTQIILRTQNLFDDASTLDEAIKKLDSYRRFLKSLKTNGFELIKPIKNDYGHLRHI